MLKFVKRKLKKTEKTQHRMEDFCNLQDQSNISTQNKELLKKKKTQAYRKRPKHVTDISPFHNKGYPDGW